MVDAILWFFTQIGMGFVNLFQALFQPALWLNWSDSEAIMRVIYYGGSVEFFFVVFDIFLLVTIAGFIFRPFMWGCVRFLEGFANVTGRFFAWAGLLMVLQQVLVVFLQSIFRMGNLTIAPFGVGFTQSVGWFSEELKLYNAMVVALCCAYTFVQGGHVRVDLFYAGAKFRTKRVVDMFGSLFFMLPMAVLIWMYGWYFLWRHLVVPKPSASDTLDRLILKARALRWNVETIAFSPNGFNGYFLFKILLLAFAAMVFLQGIAFFYRSYLEWKEGPESEGKYLDRDTLEPGEEAYDHAEF
ncbi:TRAP transporter small permease subunit [Pseudoruegeria sp. HB172150]|uniref:TRAP transporter small permease subunit n=1 Tax=Pseudoruegeria sp. HB172150 TaxID=2721164 RepID=UPI001556C1A9|nr:TRAP transporter small permease subunit [Pseudoruegeria sp. HB172150]